MEIAFLDSELFRRIILPILIFVARILDVSIGTIRIIFVARGNKVVAPLTGRKNSVGCSPPISYMEESRSFFPRTLCYNGIAVIEKRHGG